MKQTKKRILAALATASALALSISASAAGLPRGSEIDPLAANCDIGPFPQTSKAGSYNRICHQMEDAEKCLALLKGRFHYNGQTVRVFPLSNMQAPKGEYCLAVLERELGL